MGSRDLRIPLQGDTMGHQGIKWYFIFVSPPCVSWKTYHITISLARWSAISRKGQQYLSEMLFAAILHMGITSPTISFQTWKHITLCSLLFTCPTVLQCWHSYFSFYLTLLMLVKSEIQLLSCLLLSVFYCPVDSLYEVSFGITKYKTIPKHWNLSLCLFWSLRSVVSALKTSKTFYYLTFTMFLKFTKVCKCYISINLFPFRFRFLAFATCSRTPNDSPLPFCIGKYSATLKERSLGLSDLDFAA